MQQHAAATRAQMPAARLQDGCQQRRSGRLRRTCARCCCSRSRGARCRPAITSSLLSPTTCVRSMPRCVVSLASLAGFAAVAAVRLAGQQAIFSLPPPRHAQQQQHTCSTDAMLNADAAAAACSACAAQGCCLPVLACVPSQGCSTAGGRHTRHHHQRRRPSASEQRHRHAQGRWCCCCCRCIALQHAHLQRCANN